MSVILRHHRIGLHLLTGVSNVRALFGVFAEKATPEGSVETVRYKSMREFPVQLKYSSGVCKKMYKIDSRKHKWNMKAGKEIEKAIENTRNLVR